MPNSQELIIDYLGGTTFERSVAMLAKLVIEALTFTIFASFIVGTTFLIVESTSMTLPAGASYIYISPAFSY